MATLETKDFDTLVQDQATAMQALVAGNLDMSVGSILRAVAESNAAVALWLEGLIIKVLALTRASTSKGSDLDTWVGDFGLTRLTGTPATGDVNFARTLTTSEAHVPVGVTVETPDGVQFEVVASSNPEYSPEFQAYVISIGETDIDIPVQALVPGVGGNVNAGTISVLADAVAHVDSVSNSTAFTTGTEVETDASLRLRFQEFIASLARATPKAISFAVDLTEAGLTHTIIEKEDSSGTPKDGHFVVVVDDGTGSPPTSLLDAVEANVELYRPIASTFEVIGPSVVSVAVTANISVDTTVFTADEIEAAVETAITEHINELGVGAPLYLTKIAQLAYDASSGLVNISSILINAGSSDITPTSKQVIRPTSVTLTVV